MFELKENKNPAYLFIYCCRGMACNCGLTFDADHYERKGSALAHDAGL